MGDTEQLNQGDAGGVDLIDQPAAAAEENSADGASAVEEPTFEVNGEKMTVKQLQEGYLRTSDYTRKTQELAKQRQEVQPYVELANYLKGNPEAAQKVYQTLYGNGQEVDPVQLRLHQQEQTMNQLIMENSLNKVNSAIGEIKNDPKFEGLFSNPMMEQTLLATAMQTGKNQLADLKEVANEIHKEITKIRVDSQKKGEQKVIENLAKPTRKSEPGRGIVNTSEDFDPSKARWSDINKRALNYL